MKVTYHVTANEKKVGGIHIHYYLSGTGLNFMAETDGEGYADVTIPGSVPYPHNAKIYIDHPGYTMPTVYEDNVPNQDREVVLTLTPFKRGSSAGKRTGLIQRVGARALKDDQGALHGCGITFFWAMQGSRDERDRYLANLDWLQPFGYDYKRQLCEVDWDGRAIVPPTGTRPTAPWDDYAEQLAFSIDSGWERGLRTELSFAGKGTNCDYSVLANVVCDVILADNRLERIMLAEMGNEWSDHATAITMAKIVRQRIPDLACVALTNLGNTAESWDQLVAATREAGANSVTLHPARDPGDYKWRQVRQMHDASDPRIHDFMKQVNEPVGPNSSIATNDSPLQLALMRYTAHLQGANQFVLHVGDMVMGIEDPGHHRHPNLWEVEGLPAILKAVRGVDQWLPAEVENWQTTTQHGTTERIGPHPLLADGIWTDGDPHGVDRNFGAVSGQEFRQVELAVKDYVNLKADRNMHVEIFTPEFPEEMVGEGDVKAGESFHLQGREDTMAGYILVGQWT